MDWLRTAPRTTILGIAIAILVISSAFGYWLATDDDQIVAWVVVCVIGSAVLAGFLLRFVPATESEGDGNAPARRGLVLGFAAVITCVVFWTTLPIVLGIPGLVLGAEGRARSGTYGQNAEATAAIVLSGFAVLAAVVALIAGA